MQTACSGLSILTSNCQSTDPVKSTVISQYPSKDIDDIDRISFLELAIEKATAEREEIKVAIREQERTMEIFESCIVVKADSREKELRHFLAPRPVISDSDSSILQQPVSTVAPILSTVPAVRPVPTLIGGTTKYSSDGLLGPAHLPSPGTTTPHPSTTNLNSRSDSRKFTDGLPAINSEPNDGFSMYSKIPIDSSVNLVLSRLRRAQNNCNALVAASQTDLQSFTFTQNSQNGKRIMMRVRVLEQENEELANVNRTGRTAQLETEIALRQRFVQDLKQTYSDIEYLVEEAEGETELLGNSLLMLQHRLNLAKATAQVLASELEAIAPGKAVELLQKANWFPFGVSSEEEQLHCTMKIDTHDDRSCVPNTVQTTHFELQSLEQSSACCGTGSPYQSIEEASNSSMEPVRDCKLMPTKESMKRTKDHFSLPNPECNHTDSQLSLTKRSRIHSNQAITSCLPPYKNPQTLPKIPVDGPQRTFTGTQACALQYNESSSLTSELCIDSLDPCLSDPDFTPHICPESSPPTNPRKHSKQSFSNTSHSADTPSNGQLPVMGD